MELKKVDPNLVDWSKYEIPQESKDLIISKLSKLSDNFTPENNESYFKQAGKFALGSAARAAQSVAFLPEIPGRVINATAKSLGAPIRDIDYPSDYIIKGAKKLGANVNPKSAIGKAIQYTASNIPLIAATSGVKAASVSRDLAGSVGLALGESLGFDTFGKIGLSVLSQRGFNKAASLIYNATKSETVKSLTSGNMSHIDKAIKEGYQKKDILGSEIKEKTKPLVDSLEEYKNSAKGVAEFDTKQVKNMKADVDKVLEKFNGPTTTGKEIYDAKAYINKFFKRDNLSNAEKEYLKGLNKVVKDHLETISKKSPAFEKAWKASDELHALQNWKGPISEWINRNVSDGKIGKFLKNPIAQGSAAILSGLSGSYIGKAATVGALGAAAPLAIKGLEKTLGKSIAFTDYLRKTPEGQKILVDIVASGAHDSVSAINKSMMKFNREADKFQKKEFKKVDPRQIDWSKYDTQSSFGG